MKNTFGIFLSFIFITCSLQGQIAQNNISSFDDISFFVNVNNPKYNNAEGTKYLNDNFTPSKINELEKLYPIRFDLVDNIMEFKENDQEIMGLSPTRDYRIVLTDDSNQIFVSNTIINESGDLQRLFLEEIKVTQAYSLYKRERIKFVPAKPAKSSYEPEVPAVFKKMNDSYYVDYVDDGIDYLLQIPKNKKKIKTFFGNHGPEVLKFAKKEGLKFDIQENLIAILNYYVEKR
ncbi:hypothetical protein [Flagellimonas meridianipacifica]|uniref:Uncharacterized protein n=1 Tax=Flagellimonas meridianipacifica TaxID=1080225 RepID=A0A2T0M831_9FLAO|nr:hypothetical protein [Allomuricauda pacifica]PRX53628.1 hypothetical protein CLV81_2014 [Allomuricauda pacifica]